MTIYDQPGAATPPPPRAVAHEEEGATQLAPAPHRPFGRGAVDKMTDVIGTPLHKVSPLFGNAYNNGANLRTILGNAYFVLPLAGIYLGAWAVKNTHGLAIPPVLWLTLTIMVLGILDAFSGLLATAAFTVGVISTGHLFSSHLVSGPPGTQGMLYAFTGLLSMAFLWFIGPQLPRRVRLLSFNGIKNPFQRRYVITGDFFVVTLLMILILGSVPIFVPIFTGADKESLTQVVMQDHLDLIKWVVGFAAVLRVAIDTWVHAKFAVIPKSTGRERGAIATWVLRIFGASIALALIWEIVGTIWQWPVIWLLLVSLELLSAVGERFLKPSAIYRYVPRNLFRIVTLLLLCQYGARILSGRVVSGIQLLGWLVLILAIAVAIYAILDGPGDDEDGERPATWITRLIGIIVVVALFVISQGFVGIAATPYANPSAVAVSSNGLIYIADSGNNRVIQVDNTNSRDRVQLGTDLSNPSGVAPDPTASPSAIYVADTGHNRVLRVELTPAQAAAALAGAHGAELATGASTQQVVASGLSSPRGLATDLKGRLYIADTGNNRIVEVTPNGTQFDLISGLDAPVAVATDVFGNLYVADTGRGTVIRYTINKDGRPTDPKLIANGLDSPSGVAVDNQGNVFVSDTGRNRVMEYLVNHQIERVHGDFSEPRGIAVDGAGHLYITEAGSGQIMINLPLYINHTVNYGPNTQATAVASAGDGTFFVVNSDAGTLVHVTPTGTTLVASNLNQPTGVAVTHTPEEHLYVAQAGNGTVAQVNITSGAVTVLAQGLTGIGALTPDPYGNLFAVQPASGTLLTISTKGKVKKLYAGLATPTSITQDAYDYLNVTLSGKSAHGGSVWRIVPGGKAEILATGLYEPSSIAADFQGNVYFIERGTNRVWEDRGLLGTQILWSGHSLGTDPVALSVTKNGDVAVFTAKAGQIVMLHRSTVNYPL
jgi:sugar lactone lactonase YvrE